MRKILSEVYGPICKIIPSMTKAYILSSFGVVQRVHIIMRHVWKQTSIYFNRTGWSGSWNANQGSEFISAFIARPHLTDYKLSSRFLSETGHNATSSCFVSKQAFVFPTSLFLNQFSFLEVNIFLTNGWSSQ